MVEPEYYIKNGLSPIKAFEQGLMSNEQYIGFCKGNIIKYVVRAGEKDDDFLMDIVKAMDYLHYLNQALKMRKELNDKDNLDIAFKLPPVDEDSTSDGLNNLKREIEEFKNTYLRMDEDEVL